MKCFVCGNNQNFTPLFPTFTDTDNFLCMECGLVFIPREKDEFAAYYKDNGYYTESPNLAARPFFTSRSMLISTGRDRVEKIKTLTDLNLKGLKVLDIGCGYGEVLYVLKNEYTCEVLGLEPSKVSARIGSEMFGINIEDKLLGEYVQEDKFDLITCYHTLEHLEDPLGFINQMKRLLKRDGKIYLEVPNILRPSGGFDLKTFLYFEHLQTFSASTLYKILKMADLEVEAYSDNGFLDFVAVKKAATAPDIPEVKASEILAFLKKYKSGYTIWSKARVYINKVIYLVRLIWHKTLDVIYG